MVERTLRQGFKKVSATFLHLRPEKRSDVMTHPRSFSKTTSDTPRSIGNDMLPCIHTVHAIALASLFSRACLIYFYFSQQKIIYFRK